jgi:hypothetical protein
MLKIARMLRQLQARLVIKRKIRITTNLDRQKMSGLTGRVLHNFQLEKISGFRSRSNNQQRFSHCEQALPLVRKRKAHLRLFLRRSALLRLFRCRGATKSPFDQILLLPNDQKFENRPIELFLKDKHRMYRQRNAYRKRKLRIPLLIHAAAASLCQETSEVSRRHHVVMNIGWWVRAVVAVHQAAAQHDGGGREMAGAVHHDNRSP